MLEMDKIYTLSGGRLKVANLQYNTCKSQYEITFDQNAEIHLQDDDGGAIAHQLYDFSKIDALEAMEANQVVDILGVVQTVGEAATIVSKKSGQELTKCDLTVMDDSSVAISVTLWGEKARTAPELYQNQPIVAFRRVRLSDYNGKSGSLTASGTAIISPPLPQTQALQQWWTSQGSSVQSRSLSSSSGGSGGKMDTLVNRQTIAGISNQHLGTNPDKADWISFKATLTFIKKDKEGGAWYTACANEKEPCKNRFKVTQTTDMSWFCDKCQGTYPNCVRRWIFSATIADDSATTWVSLFNEQAETLFGGATADTVYGQTFDSETGGDQDKYDSYFAKANHSEWVFKCRVKQEMMGEETRVKTSVYSMHPVNYAQESRDMLDAIMAF
jgi:replication factor A1